MATTKTNNKQQTIKVLGLGSSKRIKVPQGETINSLLTKLSISGNFVGVAEWSTARGTTTQPLQANDTIPAKTTLITFVPVTKGGLG